MHTLSVNALRLCFSQYLKPTNVLTGSVFNVLKNLLTTLACVCMLSERKSEKERVFDETISEPLVIAHTIQHAFVISCIVKHVLLSHCHCLFVCMRVLVVLGAECERMTA